MAKREVRQVVGRLRLWCAWGMRGCVVMAGVGVVSAHAQSTIVAPAGPYSTFAQPPNPASPYGAEGLPVGGAGAYGQNAEGPTAATSISDPTEGYQVMHGGSADSQAQWVVPATPPCPDGYTLAQNSNTGTLECVRNDLVQQISPQADASGTGSEDGNTEVAIPEGYYNTLDGPALPGGIYTNGYAQPLYVVPNGYRNGYHPNSTFAHEPGHDQDHGNHANYGSTGAQEGGGGRQGTMGMESSSAGRSDHPSGMQQHPNTGLEPHTTPAPAVAPRAGMSRTQMQGFSPTQIGPHALAGGSSGFHGVGPMETQSRGR